ncbi:MAG TPA: hypothetical protein VE309_14640, partial [Caulobacteraceae bacterium]|nr:hypothetical protein [Caulobacteraceae bacterium]
DGMPWPPSRLAPAAAILAALTAAVVSVAAPLAVYSVTLAAFGLPHVLSELRYVDRRFGRRLGAPTVIAMAAVLALIVATRAAGIVRLLPPDVERPLELGLVAVLALTAARGQTATRGAAVAIALAIGLLAIIDPFETTIGFSILHNLTPLGFLWQLAPKNRRLTVMACATAIFIGLPLVVATGAPRLALQALGVSASTLDPLGAGPLPIDLGVYVPGRLIASAHAIDLFTASVVAQQAHYTAVIVVLPLLLRRWSPDARGLLPWPRGLLFAAPVALVAIVALSRFAVDFTGSREIYSLFAAVHAWLEIPILITALTVVQPLSKNPAPNDAALVANETSIA